MGDGATDADATLDARPDAPDVASDVVTVDAGAAYASTVLGDSPLAYYPMDETTGLVLHDRGPVGIDGVFGSGVQLGKAGVIAGSPSPHFPGGVYTTADIAQVAPVSVLEPSTAFSAELFLAEDAVNTTGQAIELVSDGPIFTAAYSVQIFMDNRLHFWLPTVMGTQANFSGATVLVPGRVYQVDATYDGTTARLYLDGKLDGSAPASGVLDYSGLSGFGVSFGGGLNETTRQSFGGRMGQVSLYQTALTPAQIAAHRASAGFSVAPGDAGPPIADAGLDAADGAVGSLAVTATSTFSGVDITAAGVVDWIVWPVPERKATGGSLIVWSDVGNITAGSGTSGAPISWTDGTPDASGALLGPGIQDDYGTTDTGVDVTFPIGTAARVVDLYVEAWNQAVVYYAYLSDGSATGVGGSLGSGAAMSLGLRRIRATASAASPGQSLVVQLRSASPAPYDGGGGGQIYIRAADIAQ